MHWTIDWVYGTHSLDFDRPLQERQLQYSRLMTCEVVQDDRDGEIIRFIWYKPDYVLGWEEDASKCYTVVDQRITFIEDWPTNGPVKLLFDTTEDGIEQIRLYRGRRKTHEIKERSVLFSRLSHIGREVWYGCLSTKSEYDRRGYNPTIKLPWRVFRLIVTGRFSDAYYQGEVGSLVKEAI